MVTEKYLRQTQKENTAKPHLHAESENAELTETAEMWLPGAGWEARGGVGARVHTAG